MNRLIKLAIGLGVSILFILPALAQEMSKRVDFNAEHIGQDAMGFNSLIGVWQIEKDGLNQVYAVEGGKWIQGELSPAARNNAAVLYGEKGRGFLKNIAVYKAFPLSIYREVTNFNNGILIVSFKAMGGKED